MAADAVRPYQGPRLFCVASLLEQEPSLAVKKEKRESAMERRLTSMRSIFRHRAEDRILFVHEHHFFRRMKSHSIWSADNLCAREPRYFLFQRSNERGEVSAHHHMVEQIFSFSKKCQVAFGVFEPIENMFLGLASAGTKPMEKRAESCACTPPRWKEPEGKDRATTIVMSKTLEEVHLRNDEGDFPFVPDCLDIRTSISILTIFG